jgi:hypothetical protein
MKNKALFLMFLSGVLCFAQKIQLQNSEKSKVSFRGLSVVNDSTLWVSGNMGTVGLSIDGGKSFQWVNPDGFSNRDFRAIAAFDTETAIVIAIASPAIILKTTDGGKNWREVFTDIHPDVFLNDLSFYDKNPLIGMAVGDPVDGEAFFLKTIDGGENWHRIDSSELPELAEGEAFFAASNSNLKLIDENSFFVVSGGTSSDLIFSGEQNIKINLPKTNSDTSGANGMDYSVEQAYGLIVGGDFMNPKSSANNLFIFEMDENRNVKIKAPSSAPKGYKSGVALLDGGKALSCGMLNVAFSRDRGQNWETISKTGFHSCKRAKYGQQVYLVGTNGRIAVLTD